MKAKTPIIAASILSANILSLGDEIAKVIDAGAEWIHLDIMDNHYVPNMTFGPHLCYAIKRQFAIIVDVHLMVTPVDNTIETFIDAGADSITFHPEATHHIDRSIKLIKNSGIKCGLALNPATPLSVLDYVLNELNMVLLMAVNPGFGGQKMLNSVFHKLQNLKKLLLANPDNDNVIIAVDGGVNISNIEKLVNCGADAVIAGNAIFNTDDYRKSIESLRL